MIAVEQTKSGDEGHVRGSGTEEPESYDGVSRFMSIGENDGQCIRSGFTLRNNLYIS